MVSFDTTKDEMRLVVAIARRAAMLRAEDGIRTDIMALEMDIAACHCNGCPLKLAELLEVDDFNFMHDIYGISAHLDRETGELRGCFLPRFAQSEVA